MSNYGKMKDSDGKTVSQYRESDNVKRKQNNVSGQGIDSSTNANAKRYTTPGSQLSEHLQAKEAKEQKKKTIASTRIWTPEKGWHTPEQGSGKGRGPDKKPRKRRTLSKSSYPTWLQELLDKEVEVTHDPEMSRVVDYLANLRSQGRDEESTELYEQLFPQEIMQDTELEGVESVEEVAKSLIEANELIKARRAQIGEVRNGRRKVAEGKWVPVKQGDKGTIQEAGKKDAAPNKEELTAQQHQQEANRHYDEAVKYAELQEQLEEKVKRRQKIDPGFKAPEKAQRLLEEVKSKVKFHTKNYQHHRAQGKQNWKNHSDGSKPGSESLMTHRAKQAQENLDRKRAEKKVQKALAELNELLKAKKPFAGYNPKKHAKTGGLNEKAREKYNRETGGNLKAPVTEKNPKGKDKKRKQSFCARFEGMKGPDYKMVDTDRDGKKEKVKTPKKAAKDRWNCKSITDLNNLFKSVISVDHQGSAIETADYNIDLEAARRDGHWLEYFMNCMSNYNYGDAPREILLDKGYTVIMSKVDDGLYSGYVKQAVDWDGQSELEENVGKIEKQTLPAVISYLKAKEYISPLAIEDQPEEEDSEEEKAFDSLAPVEAAGDGLANSDEAPAMSAEETQFQADRYYAREEMAHRLILLLDKLL